MQRVLLLLFMLFLYNTSLRADGFEVVEFSRTSVDEKYVFVAVAPKDSEMASMYITKPELDKYPETGLYRNDGSTTPLWTLETVSFSINVWIPADGVHFIAEGPWPHDRENFSDVALLFFDRGKLIKSYRVNELVAHPEDLPRSTSHYQWLNKFVLNDRVGKAWVTTLNGEKYVFEISTGKIIVP